MTQNLVLTTVEKPSRFALQDAISCFAEDAPGHSAEELTNAVLAIVGEACSLLAEGKTKEETVASLKVSGLSEECSTPFVDKAIQIVHSNQRTEESGVSYTKHWLLAAVGLVLLVGLVAVVIIRA